MSAITYKSKRREGISLIPKYSCVPRILFYVFLFYTLFLYLQGGVRFPFLGQIRFEMLMGLVLGPTALTLFLRRKDKDTGSVLAWSVALLSVMLVMVLLSQYVAYSWDVMWNRTIKFSIFGLCIASFITTPKDLRWFFGAFLLAFLKMGQEGFVGSLDGSLIWYNQEIPRLHGATPNYMHPNSFSGTQLGTLPYLYYFFPLLPWYGQVILGVQSIFCGNVILRTGSRTGYLAFIVAILAIVWLSKKRLRSIFVMCALLLMSVPFISEDYLGRFESIFEDESQAGEDTSIGQRKEILNDAIDVFVRYPWGIGVGAFPLVRTELFGRFQDTHNLYLEVLTNIGIQGGVIFFGFLLCIWRVLRGIQRDTTEQIESLSDVEKNSLVSSHASDLKFLLAASKATWTFLVIRLALGAFGMDLYEVYWWFLAGVTVAMVRINKVARDKTSHFIATCVTSKTRE
ncbi:hypothetical protein ACG33_10150 [Steroidobacter denitrificans]|uniref:O-antigen ligase-related domain-containing protein n=1 Tax=Steroidobacter denitrificans TaxID=465721 RepID=A0A127FCX8_STEDE|nr:O-antigen ligase family protein [Steroidobacter denitrificans]AMN47455.1 hypothetical protein ACG33_10150 [Steroidobacter denitrificans]